MKLVNFIVKDLELVKDPASDFRIVKPGTKSLVNCGFIFTENEKWKSARKVAEFYSGSETEFIEIKDEPIKIPMNIITYPKFYVKVYIVSGGQLYTTNTITLSKDGE